MSILTGALAIIGLLLGALIYLIPGLLAGAGEKLGLHRLAAAVWAADLLLPPLTYWAAGLAFAALAWAAVLVAALALPRAEGVAQGRATLWSALTRPR